MDLWRVRELVGRPWPATSGGHDHGGSRTAVGHGIAGDEQQGQELGSEEG